VLVGIEVLVGKGVLVTVAVGVTGVAVGAVNVKFAITVAAAWVSTASKVGFGSTVGVAGVGVAVLQAVNKVVRRITAIILWMVILEYIYSSNTK
jgi:hypothetical protein